MAIGHAVVCPEHRLVHLAIYYLGGFGIRGDGKTFGVLRTDFIRSVGQLGQLQHTVLEFVGADFGTGVRVIVALGEQLVVLGVPSQIARAIIAGVHRGLRQVDVGHRMHQVLIIHGLQCEGVDMAGFLQCGEEQTAEIIAETVRVVGHYVLRVKVGLESVGGQDRVGNKGYAFHPKIGVRSVAQRHAELRECCGEIPLVRSGQLLRSVAVGVGGFRGHVILQDGRPRHILVFVVALGADEYALG